MFTSIAIIGRPNVGKSSLFNKLTKSRDAIVSDFPGLTKDRNHGYIKLKDKKTLLIDTGGIVNQKEDIKEAISYQAWQAVEESYLIILLFDGSEDLNKVDLDIIYKLRKLNKLFITVLNKIDKKSTSSIKQDLSKNGINELGNIGEITNAFEKCYLGEMDTEKSFINLINSDDGDFSRYLFFYVNYLISNEKFELAKKHVLKVNF